jgi:hypothetical protein
MSVMMTVERALQRFCCCDKKLVPEILIPQLYMMSVGNEIWENNRFLKGNQAD